MTLYTKNQLESKSFPLELEHMVSAYHSNSIPITCPTVLTYIVYLNICRFDTVNLESSF